MKKYADFIMKFILLFLLCSPAFAEEYFADYITFSESWHMTDLAYDCHSELVIDLPKNSKNFLLKFNGISGESKKNILIYGIKVFKNQYKLGNGKKVSVKKIKGGDSSEYLFEFDKLQKNTEFRFEISYLIRARNKTMIHAPVKVNIGLINGKYPVFLLMRRTSNNKLFNDSAHPTHLLKLETLNHLDLGSVIAGSRLTTSYDNPNALKQGHPAKVHLVSSIMGDPENSDSEEVVYNNIKFSFSPQPGIQFDSEKLYLPLMNSKNKDEKITATIYKPKLIPGSKYINKDKDLLERDYEIHGECNTSPNTKPGLYKGSFKIRFEYNPILENED